jgi:HSP20 family protein
MPTIIRKSFPVLFETRREILHSVNWQVRSGVWCPPTDVYETGENFVVRIEIAGMREEDFDVAMENGVLTISGVRPGSSERCAYHQMEIGFGRFDITVEIPVPVEIESSVAEYKDGFLMINLCKATPKDIKVES